MIVIIILVILSLILSLKSMPYLDSGSVCVSILFSMLVGFLSLLGVLFVTLAAPITYKPELTKTIPITSFNENYIVTYGDPRYRIKFICYENTDYGIQMAELPAGDCSVVYTNEPARIEKYKCAGFVYWYGYIYALPIYTHYTIYIPENTITTEFNLKESEE